jgi:hypothetical protein
LQQHHLEVRLSLEVEKQTGENQPSNVVDIFFNSSTSQTWSATTLSQDLVIGLQQHHRLERLLHLDDV